jgi:L-malate glycosyltransferase
MKIGITCYPTFGGSGVVATELGIALADRGDEIHFISYALPSRLALPRPRVYFHEVIAPTYPLFVSPPYTLALATKMAEVAAHAGLDLLHVHYALPHAISAILARDMSRVNGVRMKVVTTLHGTDITIVGQDRSYLPITRYGIDQSDAVTAVSRYLRDVTIREFAVQRPVEVIPNFVDGDLYRPDGASEYAKTLFEPGESVFVHVSNFRPVKRIGDVLGIFDRVRREIPARLLLVGDGPERSLAERKAERAGFGDRAEFLGNVASIETILPVGKIFLLPSDAESFGLAALEAMACGVPVIGTNVGGLTEVVQDGENGHLRPVGDVAGMADAALSLLRDPAKWEAFSKSARRRALEVFPAAAIVARYRELYERTLAGGR